MLINFVFFKFYTKLSVSCACIDVCDCVLYCVKLDNGDTSAAEAWDEAAGSIKNTGSKVPWHSAIIASLSAPSPQHYDLQPGVCVHCALKLLMFTYAMSVIFFPAKKMQSVIFSMQRKICKEQNTVFNVFYSLFIFCE